MMKPFLMTLLGASLLSGCGQSQADQKDTAVRFVAEKTAPSGPPFSPVVKAGGVYYLAGHLGRNPKTLSYEPNIAAQTTQTLKNIGQTLSSVGVSMSDIVRCQVFMTDIAGFAEMNRAYRQFFPTNPPARTTVEVSGLAAPDALIEIECTAVPRDLFRKLNNE